MYVLNTVLISKFVYTVAQQLDKRDKQKQRKTLIRMYTHLLAIIQYTNANKISANNG